MSKTSEELLREYEPVLCFSGVTEEGEDYTERFYPLNVEAYLERCALWERRRGIMRWLLRPRDVTHEWDNAAEEMSPDTFASSPGKARAQALTSGGFGQQHFLRFIPPRKAKLAEKGKAHKEGIKSTFITAGCSSIFALVLLVATIWAWRVDVIWLAWGSGLLALPFLLLTVYLVLLATVSDEVAESAPGYLVALLLVGAAFWAREAGVTWAAWLLGVPGVVILLGGVISDLENSLTPDAADFMTMLLGLVVVIAPPLWLAARVGWRWFLALPAVAWLLTGLLAILAFGGEQGIAAFLALLSPLRRQASGRAHELCRAMRERSEDEKRANYAYYGRVWRDAESSEVVLQYFLFYAFNDWRHHGGFNFHEGDWEAVFVFLERSNGQYVPTGVGLSQHHEGDYRSWRATERWPDREKGPHPVIYVAAGSHANYFTSADKPMRSLFKPGCGQKVIAYYERFRDQFRPDAEKHKQLLTGALKRRDEQDERQPEAQGDEAAVKLEERASRRVRKAEEHPNGRGLIIGPGKPAALARQPVTSWSHPAVVLEDGALPDWAKFRGLWGQKTLLKDESGPPGPKWERAGHEVEEGDEEALKECEGCRLYWAHPLHWRDKVKQAEARRDGSSEERVE